MSENMIGIKQADGSFYPIMKEGEPAVKELELTTVRDDQTTIQLNLYKSATGTMKDAVYVDTLLIENLNPHPQGEPSINLQLNLDDEGNLSAQIDDPETGGHSDHTVSLVTLDSDALNSEPDYGFPDASDYGSPSDFADLPPLDTDFDLDSVLDGADGFDLPENDDFTVENDMTEESAATDESDFSLDDVLSDIADLPPLDDTGFELPESDPVSDEAPAAADSDFSVADADAVSAGTPAVEEAPAEASVSDTDADWPSMPADDDIFSAADSTDTVSEAASVLEETPAEDTDFLGLADFDLPDFGGIEETDLSDFGTGSDVTESEAAVAADLPPLDDTGFELPESEPVSNEAPAAADSDFSVADADAVSAGTPAVEEAPAEASLSDTDADWPSMPADDDIFSADDSTDVASEAGQVLEETPAEDTDSLDLADFDLPDFGGIDETDLSGFDTDSDMTESETAAGSIPPLDDTGFELPESEPVSGEAPAAADNDFSVADADAVSAGTPSVEEAPAEASVSDTDANWPSMAADDDNKSSADLFAGIGDLSDDSAFGMSDSIDSDFSPENKGDFDLPGLDDDLSDFSSSGDNLVYSETSFDDGLDFDTSALDNNSDDAPFSFDDLSDYDQFPETAEPEPYAAYSPSFDNDLFAANLEEAERHNRRLLLPVIICVVCAIISVAVLGITLFMLRGNKTAEDEIIEETVVRAEESETRRPVAKENEIIVSDQVFLPSFLQAEEKPVGSANTQSALSDGTVYGNVSQTTENTFRLNSGSVFAGSGYAGSASSMELALQGQYVRYKVKWGDTLWDIANSYYRNPWLYWRIAMVNNITNPNKIVAGSYIIIPE